MVRSHSVPQKKSDVVVEEVLGMIMRGEYKEGEKLPPEQFFIDYFGVSRITVREGFKKLGALGILSIKQGQGTFVNKVDAGTLMNPLFSAIAFMENSTVQIYDARIVVETGLAKLAAGNRKEGDINKMRELTGFMELAVSLSDCYRFSELDADFHFAIGEASQNSVLLTTYKMISRILSQYIQITNTSVEIIRRSLEYHRRLIDSIADQDCERAALLMEEHLEISKRELMKHLEHK